jgi:hypothetical protein
MHVESRDEFSAVLGARKVIGKIIQAEKLYDNVCILTYI